jgi:hypothetical protein
MLSMSILACACRQEGRPSTASNSESAARTSAQNALTDKWLGRWNGPEGTYIVLTKNGEKYVVMINSLDGPATYEGTGAGDHIEFLRNGKQESIHAGSGVDTGMKWLMDEKNCLVVQKSEGFCR